MAKGRPKSLGGRHSKTPLRFTARKYLADKLKHELLSGIVKTYTREEIAAYQQLHNIQLKGGESDG